MNGVGIRGHDSPAISVQGLRAVWPTGGAGWRWHKARRSECGRGQGWFPRRRELRSGTDSGRGWRCGSSGWPAAVGETGSDNSTGVGGGPAIWFPAVPNSFRLSVLAKRLGGRIAMTDFRLTPEGGEAAAGSAAPGRFLRPRGGQRHWTQAERSRVVAESRVLGATADGVGRVTGSSAGA